MLITKISWFSLVKRARRVSFSIIRWSNRLHQNGMIIKKKLQHLKLDDHTPGLATGAACAGLQKPQMTARISGPTSGSSRTPCALILPCCSRTKRWRGDTKPCTGDPNTGELPPRCVLYPSGLRCPTRGFINWDDNVGVMGGHQSLPPIRIRVFPLVNLT